MTRTIIALAIAASLIGPARADETVYRCQGVLTSNNVCIGRHDHRRDEDRDEQRRD
jgi:hypothetical protein